MSIWNRSCPMWCTLGSTRTMTWISKCRGLMTLLQPSHPLCYQGSSAVFGSLEARGTQRACFSQYGRGPVGSQWSSCWPDAPGPSRIGGSAPHVRAAEVETEGNKLYKQGGIDLDQTLPGFDPEDAAAVIISDDNETSFPVDTLRLSLHQKLNQPGARSDPWRTGAHAHLLQRSGLQRKRRRVCLLMKPFYPEGCQRKTSSPRDMNLYVGLRLGPARKVQSPRTGGWHHALTKGH